MLRRIARSRGAAFVVGRTRLSWCDAGIKGAACMAEVDFSNPVFQEMLESRAILDFLRTLSLAWSDLDRDLADPEWTAFRALAKKGAVEGVLRFTRVYGDPPQTVVECFRLRGDPTLVDTSDPIPAGAAVDVHLARARLTGRGKRWADYLAAESRQDPVQTRGAVLTLLWNAPAVVGSMTRTPPLPEALTPELGMPTAAGVQAAETSAPAIAGEPTRTAERETCSEPEYRFAYESGGHWLVRYEGRKVGLFSNNLGFRYIYELIFQQERPISAVTLRDHCRVGGPGRPLVTVADIAEDREDALATLGRELGGGEMADKETLAEVLQQMKDWEAEREACTNPMRAAEISESIAKAQKYLNQAKDPTGRLRPMPSDYRKNAADSVRAAIQAAIRKIKKCDTPCGLHFRRNIRCGTSPSYAPNPPVQWDIS